MAGTPIEQLQLSVRASNVLHRLGIHNIEELIKTPLKILPNREILAQRRLMKLNIF